MWKEGELLGFPPSNECKNLPSRSEIIPIPAPITWTLMWSLIRQHCHIVFAAVRLFITMNRKATKTNNIQPIFRINDGQGFFGSKERWYKHRAVRFTHSIRTSCLSLCVCCSATLLAFLVELLKSSVAMQEQMLGGKGFLVIGYLLEKVSKSHSQWAVGVYISKYMLLGD